MANDSRPKDVNKGKCPWPARGKRVLVPSCDMNLNVVIRSIGLDAISAWARFAGIAGRDVARIALSDVDVRVIHERKVRI